VGSVHLRRQWEQKSVGGNDDHRAGDGLAPHPGTRERTHRGRGPQCRRRVQPGNRRTLLHDHSGAEKPDAGDDLGSNPSRITVAVERIRAEDQEECGSHADQGHGLKACHPRSPLAFDADRDTEEGRQSDPDEHVDSDHDRALTVIVSCSRSR
jgi:hypothetical protein